MFLFLLVHIDASVPGYKRFMPITGYNLGYNYGFTEGYNNLYGSLHNTEYNKLYENALKLGYNAGYNPYNNPIEDTEQGTQFQTVFRAVPAVPAAEENSFLLPEPIFGVEQDIVKPIVSDYTKAAADVLAVGDHHGDVPHVGGDVGDVSEQYHAQDEYGNHEYGYSNLNSAKHEVGVAGGGVRGSYSWRDDAGYHTVHYVADKDGYRIVKRR